ncbi:hypothetical protein DIPPA_02911 [Diplonema papillatum]|nr:hypothetical protein DIPPA_02911 [Diplonema papillatum]
MKRVSAVCRRLASTSAEHAEVAGAAHKAQLNNTIGYYLSAQARRLGHRTAFRVPHQGVNWTYIDIKKNSDAFGDGLVQHGVKPGDRILSIQSSTAELFMTHASCSKIGAIAVHVNPSTLTADSIAAAIDKYQPKAIVLREFAEVPSKNGSKRKSMFEILHQAIPELDQVVGNLYLRSPKYPSVKLVVVTDANWALPGAMLMRNMLAWGPYNYYENPLRRISTLLTADTPSLILPSAVGNTRDVVFSHRNIMTAAFHVAQYLGLTNDTRVMLAPSTSHHPVFFLAHYSTVASGASISYGGECLLADSHVGPFLENLEIERVHGLLATKAQLDLLLPAVSGQGAGEYLKWVVIVSMDPVSEAYAKEVKEAFKVEKVCVMSGPLEAGAALSLKTLGQEAKETLMPNVKARVVGDEGGEQAKTLGRNKEGNLRLCGPSVAVQYWNNGGLMEADRDVLGFYDFEQEASIDSKGSVVGIKCTAA